MFWGKEVTPERISSATPERFSSARARAKPEKMLGRFAAAAFILLSFCLAVFSAGNGTVEKITGTVVAYDYVKAWVPCLTGECEGSLIVRIDSPDQVKPRYVRIDFRFAQGKPPRKLVQRKRQWHFKLIRTSDLDESIDEFITYEKTIHSEERKVPIWKLVPGAENEKLPFGEILPSYSLVKSGFKPTGNY